MKLPRVLSGRELAKALVRFGDTATRQTGAHIRLTTQRNGEHHVTIPDHDSLKPGTLAGILTAVRERFDLSRDELLDALFS